MCEHKNRLCQKITIFVEIKKSEKQANQADKNFEWCVSRFQIKRDCFLFSTAREL